MPRTLPTALLIALLLLPSKSASSGQTAQTLLLELRVFNGYEEVTNQTRVFLHRAGDRGTPVAEAGGGPPRIELKVDEGIYDVQAVRERDGQVVNIQWANRLVVMAYPDEAGQHLEVINFKTGFGALQIRGKDAEIAIFEPGKRDKPVTAPIIGAVYALFVVKAGPYDVRVNRGAQITWHPNVDVPLDRTRLWIVPDGPG